MVLRRTPTRTYGDESSVVRIHSGNGPHDEMDRRAIACFDQGLADIGLTDDYPVPAVLHDYWSGDDDLDGGPSLLS